MNRFNFDVGEFVYQFISDLFKSVTRIPLLIFFVTPVLIITIGLQENGYDSIGNAIVKTLFIGSISQDGSISINSGWELAKAMVFFLFILQILHVLWKYIKSRLQIRWSDQLLSHLILFSLWAGAFTALLNIPRQGSDLAWTGIFLMFYLIGKITLFYYQRKT